LADEDRFSSILFHVLLARRTKPSAQ